MSTRSALDLQLPEVLYRLATWVRRATPATEWNSVALSALANVVQNGPKRVTDLVSAERITQPGMTALVGRLAAAGLVTRGPDPDDGRATLVSATPVGQQYLEQIHRAGAEVFDRHLSKLSSDHRASLAGALGALSALAFMPVLSGGDPDAG